MSAGRKKRDNLIRKIEKEFDEPIADIIIGMRQQGCSWGTIAGALGVGYNTVLSWRKEFGFAPIDPSVHVVEEDDRAAYKDRIAQKLGYSNFNSLYFDFRVKRRMLVSEVAREIGVHENTIYKWIPDNMKQYMYIETKRRIVSRDRNLAGARAAMLKKHGTLYTGEL
jgi:transposase